MLSYRRPKNHLSPQAAAVMPAYGSRYLREPVPRYEIPETGLPPQAAYQLIHDELNLDGNPVLNLASFVTTWMEPEAEKLIVNTLNKNLVDQDEYPRTGVIQERALNMLAHLFNVPPELHAVGTSTVGSSEAIMLGLLAHKTAWRERRKAAGKAADRPNIVVGADVHVVWEKFARYFDVELRLVPMERDRYVVTAAEVISRVDENTVCVGAVLGTTFTGQIDPIRDINDALERIKREKGWDIPIHVDGASGAFVMPFLYPDFVWDFRLERVRSINASGHKFGLVYPGIGWLVFRDRSDLPDSLVFRVNYLGSEEETYTLNFSRGSAMMLAQYYNFIRLGKDGYRRIAGNCVSNARYLSKGLEATGLFNVVEKEPMLPVVAFRLKEESPGLTAYDLSHKLRERGWIVPAYSLPPNAEDVTMLRVVVKENFSREMADTLVADIRRAHEELVHQAGGRAAATRRHPRRRRPLC